MLNLLSVAVCLIIGVVAVEICRREHAWRDGWRNKTTSGIAFASVAAMVCATLFETPVSVTRIWITIPVWFLLLWPLLGASVWLGRASGCPVEGTLADAGWRRMAEGLTVIGVCALGTYLLKEVFGWQVHGGWGLPFLHQHHSPRPSLVAVWSVLIMFGLAAAEELFYRGVLLRWLRWEARNWKYGPAFAVLLSSVIFYLGHGSIFSLPKFIQTMLLGTGLAWISVRHGLWAAVVVHWLFNILVSVTLP